MLVTVRLRRLNEFLGVFRFDQFGPKELIEHADTATLNDGVTIVEETFNPGQCTVIGHHAQQVDCRSAVFEFLLPFENLVAVTHCTPGPQLPKDRSSKLAARTTGDKVIHTSTQGILANNQF